jgi:hypothetical protein
MPVLHAVCTRLLHSIQLYRHALFFAGKKGVSLQQSEWQELRRDDGKLVQAAVDSLQQQSDAAAGTCLMPNRLLSARVSSALHLCCLTIMAPTTSTSDG